MLNASDLGGSRVVRRLARDLADDPDAALVAVARGDFECVAFSLGDLAQQQERAAHAARSNRRHVGQPSRRVEVA